MKYKRSGLAILAVALFAMLFGVSYLTGQNVHHGPAFQAIGAVLVVGTITVLAMTAHRWAGYFCAICFLMVIKAILFVAFGYHTLSGTPERVATYGSLFMPEFLGLFMILIALTYRFTIRPPRSKLEVVALVGGVVGIALDMMVEPNFWPLRCAVLLFAVSWIVDRLTRRRHPHAGHVTEESQIHP